MPESAVCGRHWAGTKIAKHLDVSVSTVNNIVRKNGLVRKPRAKVVETVALADAPVAAWQQAVLPELQQAAEADGLDDAWQRAFIIFVLLRWKPYPSLAEFETWACPRAAARETRIWSLYQPLLPEKCSR
jgi:hypothetical protein